MSSPFAPFLLWAGVLLARPTDGIVKSAPSRLEERRTPDGGFARTVTTSSFLRDVRFDAAPGEARPGERGLVVATVTWKERSGVDGDDVTLVATAYEDGEKPYGRVRWTVTDHATSASKATVGGRTYLKTTLDISGTAEPLDRYYDVATGRFAFAATTPPVELARDTRAASLVFTYLGVRAWDALPGAAKDECGRLTLHRADGTSATLAFRGPGGGRWSPEWGLAAAGKKERLRLLLDSPSAPAAAPVSLALTFDDVEGEARIPLASSDFDLENATLPAGLRVDRSAAPGKPERRAP